VSAPAVASVKEIRRAVSVDAMTTGFAFVVRELVARSSLAEADATFDRANRDPLPRTKHDATHRARRSTLAETRGYHAIATAGRSAPTKNRGARATGRAREARSAVVGFLRVKAATDWLYDRANRDIAGVARRQHPRHVADAGEALLRSVARRQGRPVT
jgi:hypothetical protein